MRRKVNYSNDQKATLAAMIPTLNQLEEEAIMMANEVDHDDIWTKLDSIPKIEHKRKWLVDQNKQGNLSCEETVNGLEECARALGSIKFDIVDALRADKQLMPNHWRETRQYDDDTRVEYYFDGQIGTGMTDTIKVYWERYYGLERNAEANGYEWLPLSKEQSERIRQVFDEVTLQHLENMKGDRL